MNCFQFSIFAFAKTTIWKNKEKWKALWIAFNLVSLHLQKQHLKQIEYLTFVVNCFQFSIFAFAKTTKHSLWEISRVLWIAFNLVSLHLQKQQTTTTKKPTTVVNCFQFSIFAFAKTTYLSQRLLYLLLWIAFNLVSLHLQKQL